MERYACRRKKLEIVKCKQCHYLERRWQHKPLDISSYCLLSAMNSDTEDQFDPIFRIPNPGEIPKWCPLEDWPDE